MSAIIGHQGTIRYLKKLVDDQRLSHAYLFHGPSMVGKRLVAESFANYLENGAFAGGAGTILFDAKVFAPDESGSFGIDAVRKLQEFLSKKPIKSSRRTAIVDEAEKMTAEAQNAALRIAEEPPPSSLLVLIASDSEAIFETLLSRLAKVYFSLVPTEEILKWLEKEFGLKKAEAEKLAQKSFGKPGLAYALKNNIAFVEQLRLAEKFFDKKRESGREFIKKLVESENFIFNDFLDALIFYLTAKHEKRSAALWHKLLELRSRSANFALNPRLQLENLLYLSY